MKVTITRAWYIWITCCGVIGTLVFGLIAWMVIGIFTGLIAD